MEDKKRIAFIDLAKGVCIVLVVMFHSGINLPGLEYIRMPLYFIISGIFFKKYEGFQGFVLRKVNKIIIPFLFFFILSYIFYAFLEWILPGVSLDKRIPHFYLSDPFYSRVMFNHPLWFLLALFGSNILFYSLHLMSKRKTVHAVLVLLVTVIGIYLCKSNIELPFYLNSTLTYFPFFYFGYLLKGTSILYSNRYDAYNLCFVALGVVAFGASYVFNFVERSYVVGYVMCIVGVLTVLFLCKWIGSLPLVTYYGRYSLVVLCTHSLIDRPVKFFLTSCWPDINNHVLLVLIFLITLLLELPIIYFSVRYLGYVTAQKDVLPLCWLNGEKKGTDRN